MFTAFATHIVEIAIYGPALFLLLDWMGVGTLRGTTHFSLINCFYFSVSTYVAMERFWTPGDHPR